MKRRSLLWGLAASAVALAVDAKGDAPGGQYGYFGPYDVTILDNGTKLTWQRGFGPPTDFAGAAAYCASLPPSSAGWRVPSYKELLSLVDERPHDEFTTGVPVPTAIDGNAFTGTPASPFWTSSRFADGRAYYVRFSDGSALLNDLSGAYFVRCVQR